MKHQDWILSDRDSVSVCIGMLRLQEIASLYCTCKAWQSYISHPPVHVLYTVQRWLQIRVGIAEENLKYEFEVNSDVVHLIQIQNPIVTQAASESQKENSALQSLATCTWIQRYVKRLDISPPIIRVPTSINNCHAVLLTCSYFTHISRLTLELDFSQIAPADIEAAFEAIAPSLTYIDMENNSHHNVNYYDSALSSDLQNQVFQVCPVLFDLIGKHLHGLTACSIRFILQANLNSDKIRQFHSLSLAFLQQLPRLTSLQWTSLHDDLWFSSQQLTEIIQCKQLQMLYASLPNLDREHRPHPLTEEKISFFRALPAAAALESTGLLVDRLIEECIPHLIRNANITDIAVGPLNDYSFLQYWPLKCIRFIGTKLEMFQLQQMRMEENCILNRIQEVLHIHTITELEETNAIISRSEFKLLVKCISLQHLLLRCVRLDPSDTMPLLNQSTLQQLSIFTCRDLNGYRIQWNEHIHILKKLQNLLIQDC